ncbi:MAG: YbaL family putative K(+) efflux transporter [Alphaproteobacteria bacterium]
MPHHAPLIAAIVIGLVLAFVLGAIANRLRISPLVGYLLAGVVVGPATPGLVIDQELTNQLAEIGVILLMFGVGLHFSLKDLLSVKAIAIPGAVVQIAIATLLGVGLSYALGWSLGAGLVFGLALSVASTVVLLRALQDRRLIDTERGRIAVGWLIVEDLAMVLALVLLPGMAGFLVPGEGGPTEPSTKELAIVLAITIGKVVAFVAFMLIVGRRVIPWLLHYIAHTGSRELFRLSVLAIALGVAYGAALLFDVSFALGAFFAGMMLAESELSSQAASETLPLRDAFAVLFFVSVGMLVDPMIVVRDWWPVLATVLIIVLGKSVAAFLIVRAFGHGTGTALTISASLAQIGEFSFILAGLGVALGLMPDAGRDLILAGAILSIFLNPFAFAVLDRLKPWIARRDGVGERTASAEAEPETHAVARSALAHHAVIVGYGRVGSAVGEALAERGQPFLVVEERKEIVDALRARGVEAILGPLPPTALAETANVAQARWMFVAVPNGFEAGQIVVEARQANPALEIVARAHSDAEVEHLSKLGAQRVIMGEREIARGMVDYAFGDVPKPA